MEGENLAFLQFIWFSHRIIEIIYKYISALIVWIVGRLKIS